VGIASNTGNQKLQQPFKPLTAHGWTSLFSLTTSHSSPGVSQLYPDGWMDGWMDGRTDGWTDRPNDGVSFVSLRHVLKLSKLPSSFTINLLLHLKQIQNWKAECKA